MKNSGKWSTLVGCSLSCFIGQLDFAIVNTALPAIESDLTASLVQLQWVINAFILALTTTIVTWGRIGDLWGRRLVNVIGVSLFGAASLCAGLASSVALLICFRAVQGLAAAAIIPSSIALISHAFPPQEKGMAIGIWSGIAGLGMALGPVLGGMFVSFLSWRWVFYINVPIAAISVLITLLFVQESVYENAAKKIDWKGVGLLLIGLLSLIGGLMHAPDWGWDNGKTWGAFGIAILALLWFYRSERHSHNPTIPFALFMNPGFLYSTLAIVCLMFVFTAMLFLIPLYLINIHHEKPYVTGLLLLPITGCIAFASPLIGHLADKISRNVLVLTGMGLYCLSTLMQVRFSPTTSLYVIIGSLVLLGLGWAVARNPATATAIASAPHHLAATAAGVLWTVQNGGGALSIAITGTMFRTIFETSSTPASFLAGYHVAMWFLSAVTFCIGLILPLGAYGRIKKNH